MSRRSGQQRSWGLMKRCTFKAARFNGNQHGSHDVYGFNPQLLSQTNGGLWRQKLCFCLAIIMELGILAEINFLFTGLRPMLTDDSFQHYTGLVD